MVFTFGAADTFRNCPTKTCGIGKIRHHIAQTEHDGKHFIAYQCSRCKRLEVEERAHEQRTGS